LSKLYLLSFNFKPLIIKSLSLIINIKSMLPKSSPSMAILTGVPVVTSTLLILGIPVSSIVKTHTSVHAT
jgi:hypothetical protein